MFASPALFAADEAVAVDRSVHAYEEAPSAALAFEIASTYERINQPEKARAYYNKCLAFPEADPELVAKAKERISAIDVQAVTSASIEGLAPAAPRAPPTSTQRATMMMSSVEPPWSSLKTWALVFAGTGVVSIGIGATFAVLSKEKTTEADQYCTGNVCSSDLVPDLRASARSDGHVAAVTAVIGAALLTSGVVLWLLAPNPSAVTAATTAEKKNARPTAIAIGATPFAVHGVW